ncbi:DUF7528 family protein [Halocalculus aciditolerans]|uniref:Uncharacterized protein n=1 Tax=Halocalculus aciditolerans TaxID=1383812 RepID=A0A830F9J5_9EURY|nr:hypothetical protein [Halocalculus aciditolerans]GGL53081.1 hypothetical protein GCM10009039_09110 [Halocalculus aciditolerans]
MHEVSRSDAAALCGELEDALTEREEFLHTACEHREDGGYVVERRNASSAGHRKVFDSVDALCRLYDRLPDSFTADDLDAAGVTGSRRHMLVWHFAEHPRFDCSLASKQPLTAAKDGGEDDA